MPPKSDGIITNETVIKCCLKKRLKDPDLWNEINRWVENVSKTINRGSLIFNRLLLHCLENKIEIPDLTNLNLYLQCMNIGIGRLNKPIQQVVDTYKKYFSIFPLSNKIPGDITAYNYAARKYLTNFKNSIIYTFEKRQKHHIISWCLKNGLDKEDWYPIRCAINHWNCKTPYNDKATGFIACMRFVLGNPDIIDKKYLKDHMKEVVTYYWYILQSYNEGDRKFTLAPVAKIKRHFLTIDTIILRNLLQNIGYEVGNKVDRVRDKEDYWTTAFNISEKDFTYLVETDGVSLCIHKRREKKPSKEIDISNKRVVAIDPGRSNIIYGVDQDDRVYSLTRKTYYQQAGIKKCSKKTKGWEEKIKWGDFKEYSIKTISSDDWKKYLTSYIENYENIWREKLGLKWSRSSFRSYTMKRKCLDRFFSSFKENKDDKIVIAYGAAKFNPTGKHELSVPTTSISKRCSSHYPTIFVDEYNTTKTCSRCGEVLTPCKDSFGTIRNLRWCNSTNCRRFINRDQNAARNILKIFLSPIQGEERPLHLSRDSERVRIPKALLLRDALMKIRS